MQYIDLEPFEKYLRERGLVDEAHLQHYVRWVLRFLRSELGSKPLSNADLLQGYADQLDRDDSVQEWQLRQAMQRWSFI